MLHRARVLFVCSLLTAPGLAARAVAQEETTRVLVRDSTGRAIPYASVQAGGANPRTTTDSGVVMLRTARADSLKLLARRIGFEPWEGWVRPNEAGEYIVLLRPLPQNLNRVTIYEPNTPLARAGFYDRMERVRRGAYSARFWTPEAIELRNPSRTSVLFEGENIIRVRPTHGKPILMGRGGSCPVTVLVDGQRVLGMVEEMATPEGQRELARLVDQFRRNPNTRGPAAQEAAERAFIAQHTSVDELVNTLGLVAVEIYASIAAAPAELQRNASSNACALVAIWTGRRDR